jgi:hypothetical protein
MGSKAKPDPRDTYIFSDDVMDEMENLEATVEIVGLEDLPLDDDATAAIKTTGPRKAARGDSS